MSTTSGAVPQPIVVGVDGSPHSVQALRWAVQQAQLTGAPVQAVTAWQWPTVNLYTPAVTPLPDISQQTRAALARVVADALNAQPDVDVEQQVVEGHPVTVLLEKAKSASLLVVGSRGHDGFTGMLLGSVGSHCVSHAPCSVVVVRPDAQP